MALLADSFPVSYWLKQFLDTFEHETHLPVISLRFWSLSTKRDRNVRPNWCQDYLSDTDLKRLWSEPQGVSEQLEWIKGNEIVRIRRSDWLVKVESEISIDTHHIIIQSCVRWRCQNVWGFRCNFRSLFSLFSLFQESRSRDRLHWESLHRYTGGGFSFHRFDMFQWWRSEEDIKFKTKTPSRLELLFHVRCWGFCAMISGYNWSFTAA